MAASTNRAVDLQGFLRTADELEPSTPLPPWPIRKTRLASDGVTRGIYENVLAPSETLIHAAAHSDAFKAVISEGASGQSSRDGWANGDRLEPLLGGGANTLASAVFTNTLPPVSLKSEVTKIAPTAVFFIYGERGQGGTEAGRTRVSSRQLASPSRSGRSPAGSTSPASRRSPRSTSAASSAFSTTLS